jgi:maleate cis-trans isomerase
MAQGVQETRMFEGSVPRLKIGCLMPGSVIDNHAFEFYRLAPPGVMLVMVGVGLREFSRHDVERVFAPLEHYLDQLTERGVDLVIQNGVPLPILIGIEAHDRMVAHMARYTRLPATSTVLSVVQAAADLGIRKVVPVNKWTEEMNRALAAFFARAGVRVIGTSTKPSAPADFHRFEAADHMRLAYELGRRAFLDHTDCDAIYIGGGSWIAEPVAARLEAEFGKPVLCNQAAVIRNALKMLGAWTPLTGHSRVLAAP